MHLFSLSHMDKRLTANVANADIQRVNGQDVRKNVP